MGPYYCFPFRFEQSTTLVLEYISSVYECPKIGSKSSVDYFMLLKQMYLMK